MNKVQHLIRLGCFIGCLFSSAAFATDKVFDAETFTLKNGMQVVVIPNHRAPVVSHMVWYKVGAADEPQGDGVSGAAHFLEHLMFKGSKAIKAGEFSKIIRSIGGEDNAFTSWDYTAYFQSVSKSNLSTVMALEAERMINITLPEAEIEKERKVIIEERRMRVDNDPQQLFSEQLRALLFTATPYEVPILGWHDEMPKLARADVLNYYKKWYAPNNAILVISGDVTTRDVKPLAEKFYGVIPFMTVPEHTRPIAPDFPAPVRVTYSNKDIHEPVFMRGWRAPGFMMNKHDSLALEVLVETLDGGASTDLYQSLVVKNKKATNINLSYDAATRGEGSIWLNATPAPNVTLEELELALDSKMDDLIGNGIKATEIEKAKSRMIDRAIYARDSVMGPAMTIGQNLSYGASLDDIENWPALIAKIKPNDVQIVLEKYLHPATPAHHPVTGYLKPLATADKR